jgi:hypothetical protein
MTNEELYRALIMERFRDVQEDPEVRQRPASHGGADSGRACSTRRRALVASMKGGQGDK